jgi:hypothetical protein
MTDKELKKIFTESADCIESNKTVAEEHKRKFVIESSKNDPCCRIRVDGCLIKDMKMEKCDFWFHHCSESSNVFVELKGQNIKKAYAQILSTLKWVKPKIDLLKDTCHAAIVVSKSPLSSPEIQNLKIDFKKKYGNRLEIKQKELYFKF